MPADKAQQRVSQLQEQFLPFVRCVLAIPLHFKLQLLHHIGEFLQLLPQFLEFLPYLSNVRLVLLNILSQRQQLFHCRFKFRQFVDRNFPLTLVSLTGDRGT